MQINSQRNKVWSNIYSLFCCCVALFFTVENNKNSKNINKSRADFYFCAERVQVLLLFSFSVLHSCCCLFTVLFFHTTLFKHISFSVCPLPPFILFMLFNAIVFATPVVVRFLSTFRDLYAHAWILRKLLVFSTCFYVLYYTNTEDDEGKNGMKARKKGQANDDHRHYHYEQFFFSCAGTTSCIMMVFRNFKYSINCEPLKKKVTLFWS